MAVRDLPARPSMEHLRNEARALKRLILMGDPAAVATGREFHPRFDARAAGFRLSDAQLVVARGYGFATWSRLKAFVDTVVAHTRAPHEVTAATGDDAEEFLRLACLVYGGDDLARPARASEMLRREPMLARRSIHTAAAAGDAVVARAMLARDGSLARTPGGPFGWEPLLYAAFSRVANVGSGHSQAAVARLLLTYGADPNAGYLWEGTCLFTALTGAFGYGEDALNQPPHPESLVLAELLLAAGADPNDDQTIYNRHFRPANDYLELLLARGLGGPRRGPWPRRLGERLAEPRLLLEDALAFAADLGHTERVGLLLEHGVDADCLGTRHPVLRGLRPVQLASSRGAQDIVDLLLGAGARPLADDEVDHLLGLCMRGDRDAVRRMLADDPAHAAALRQRRPEALVDAADRGKASSVELLAEIGYDVNAGPGHAALHVAAYQGDREICELLLRLGAAPTIRDASFDAIPAGWARHAHHDSLADWLEERAGEATS